MILIINTIVSNKLYFALAEKGKIIKKIEAMVNRAQAEKSLVLIDRLFREVSRRPRVLKGIVVVSGPGGFSSVRLGVLIANTLSYALNIPSVGLATRIPKSLVDLAVMGTKKLLGKKGFNLVRPFYGAEPHITKVKKY